MGTCPHPTPPEDFEARDPLLPPAAAGHGHEIELRASNFEAHVGGGAVQQLWGFDDQVPGPTLRAKVGDTFIVTFVTDADMSHSIDFHASKVARNVEMRSIPPGESLTFEFEARHAGIWMYHCGTAPVLLHTGNGQYGAVVVDPPELFEVDHEYVFVQSEFYLGADGDIGDLAKMQDEPWDIVAFNGFADQYAHAPISDVEVGERVRVWVLNAGPSENGSLHVLGPIVDTVGKGAVGLFNVGAVGADAGH